MRKVIIHNSLANRHILRNRRTAFSLAELIVAVGILILMLSLAGQVFSLTARSTGQAAALTDVHQNLRAFERTLRDDLRSVRPGESVLFIQARPVKAYWQQAGIDADDDNDPLNGYPHPQDPERECVTCDNVLAPPRADKMMFFAPRKTNSAVFENTTAQAQQIVYAHGNLGEYISGGQGKLTFDSNPDAFPLLNSQDASPVAASTWHLARRNLLLMPVEPPSADVNGLRWANSLWEDGEGGDDTISVLKGTVDVVGNFSFENLVLQPADPGLIPLQLPQAFYDSTGTITPLYSRSSLDLTPPARKASTLGHYFLPNCASFKVEWALDPNSTFVGGRLDYERELIWIDPGGGVWVDDQEYNPLRELEAAFADASQNGPGDRFLKLRELLATGVNSPQNAATGFDGLQEYTLLSRFRDNPEWRFDEDGGKTYTNVFLANRADAGVYQDTGRIELLSEDIFPAAIRVTVDVYDSDNRLERPVRHVMVVPVGR